jgi:hypothetical protein
MDMSDNEDDDDDDDDDYFSINESVNFEEIFAASEESLVPLTPSEGDFQEEVFPHSKKSSSLESNETRRTRRDPLLAHVSFLDFWDDDRSKNLFSFVEISSAS